MTGLAATQLERLAGASLDEVEVYYKRGRTRRYERRGGDRAVATAAEAGWAVRASSPDGSWFLASTAPPPPFGSWPEPCPERLRLPPPRGVSAYETHAATDGPLLGEVEALQLLDSIADSLAAERPGAELVRAVLEDGTSHTEIVNSRGVAQEFRHRGALFHLQAADAASGGDPAVVQWPVQDVRAIAPRAWTQRLVSALSVRAAAPLAESDRADVILAPAVGSRLVRGLAALVVGPRSRERARRFENRAGEFASPALSWVDDGRHPRGAARAPVDGEGMPTRRVVLVERGRWRQPLVDWRTVEAPAVASGCALRSGWRDRPVAGPTHLHWEAGEAAPGDLLQDVARGYYLLDAVGRARFDFEGDRFSIDVCGFRLFSGRAVEAFSAARLSGSIHALLHGVRATARDLTFASVDGRYGSPTALVSGLEVEAIDQPGGAFSSSDSLVASSE